MKQPPSMASAVAQPDVLAELRLAHRRLEQAYRQIGQDLEAARRVQRSFQPTSLPDLPPVRFGVYARTSERTGGDCCDAFRVDATHVAFYLATVVGRGVPGALLGVCLRKLRNWAVDSDPCAVFPDEVVQRLNEDLLALELPDSPFVTMVYGVLNCRDGLLRFVRAGHPHPVHLPAAGPARVLQGEGGLLGVLPAHSPLQTCRLIAGDRLLLRSDGLIPQAESPGGMDRFLVAALEHRELTIQEHVERAAHDLRAHGSPVEDATLLAVEMGHFVD